MSRPAHNFQLAAPLAAIGRRELARIGSLNAQCRDQTSLLLALLADVSRLSAVETATGWNGYSPLLHLRVPRPRSFSEHLARHGVPNSTGTFRLMPLDQRSAFTNNGTPAAPCVNAAAFLDGTLAVALTRHDDPTRIRRYGSTIIEEVARWAGA